MLTKRKKDTRQRGSKTHGYGSMKKNMCTVRSDSSELRGMLVKAKDFITWGEIDEQTMKMLMEKRRSKGAGDKENPDKKGSNKENPKMQFSLNPPRKGYGRKGIKKPFSSGGALGYRGEKINELIKRMI